MQSEICESPFRQPLSRDELDHKCNIIHALRKKEEKNRHQSHLHIHIFFFHLLSSSLSECILNIRRKDNHKADDKDNTKNGENENDSDNNDKL